MPHPAVYIGESSFQKEVMNMNDTQLIELYIARSENAIAQTQQQYGAYCKKIASSILESEQDTEECLSDVWLKVWNAIPPQTPEYFKGWLATITRNSALTLCRRQAREPQSIGDAALELSLDLTDGPEERLDTRVLGEAISRFLEQEPRHIRTAFLRRYWYGDSVEETAKFMGWGQGKTKTILYRTRKKLKEYLIKEELYHG